jgi:hypothetical protein
MKFIATIFLLTSLSAFAQVNVKAESYLMEKEENGQIVSKFLHAVVVDHDEGCVSSMLTKETSDNLAKVTNEFIENFDYKCADGREMSSQELV